jgi:hypothetical protein
MAYFRRPKDHEHPYAQIANELLEDPSLSLKAKGLLAYLLSRSDDWEVYQQQLQKVGPDGRTSIRSALEELREAGYLDRIQWRAGDGRFSNYEYIVYEEPRSPGLNEEIRTENQNPEKGDPENGKSEIGNPATTNTDNTNTESTNTERGGGARAREAGAGGEVMPEQLAAVYDTYEELVNNRLDLYAPEDADQLVSSSWGQLTIGSATMQLVNEYSWPLFVTGVTIAEHEADSPNARFLHTVLKRLHELIEDDTDYTEASDDKLSNLDRLANIAANA